MIDRETVRNHYKRYRKGGLPALLKNDAGGSETSLSAEQLQQLSQHFQKNLLRPIRKRQCQDSGALMKKIKTNIDLPF